MQLPSHLMFAIHSSIGLSLKGHHMGIGRISSVGVSGPVEGSGAAKPWAEGSLDSWLTSVSPDIADHHHKMNSDHWIVDTNLIILH